MSGKSTRIILDDPRFGKLSYHQKFKPNFDFPSNQVLCWHPFNYIEVRRHGAVNVCCPQWNPAEIGNLQYEELENIWAGYKANIIRDSILNGSYSYCNSETCPKIQNWRNELISNTEEKRNDLINSTNSLPTHVHFVIDHSCNLECPSCRVEKITQLSDGEKEQGLTVARKVIKSMFSEPHNDYKVIGMDGSGEIFSSELYRELFETEEIFTHTYKWPNLRFALSTNGTMMTEKNQKKYENFFKQISRIEISIDAGNQESYEKVRKGGHWDLLWKNLDYFYSNIKDKKETYWQWNIIVQKNNFESIPEFVELANNYSEYKPSLNFSNLLNWGTWTDNDYLENAVHLPSHPLHNKYLEIKNLPIVGNYKSDQK
jgi:wyosine [tRNA(Phe)-imidazoG37] synthetase (radical SAM superfamily)